MKIGINGRFLVAKKTGVQRAAYNLVRTLVSVDRLNQYIIFTGKEEIDKPEWQYPNVTIVSSPLHDGQPLKSLLWEQFVLPHLAKKYNVDILHSPANMAPLFYKGRSLIHIHDVCFVVNPQWYSFLFRTWYNWVIPRLAKKAVRVITNSNNSKNDLLQFCNLSVDKVSLVYWAVDDAFLNNRKQPDDKNWPIKDYILYVGSLEPRKNIKTLIDAFQRMRKANTDLETKLILIGGESPLFAELKLKIKEFKEDIILKGFVGDHDLLRYYRNASLVAYPSFYEGFGLPPLEAMACGTPVVTSMSSSLPEVVGDAAILVNPYDTSELADAMCRVLKDQNLRKRLKKAGLQQVKRFNWYRVARNILGIYYEVYVGDTLKSVPGKHYMPFDLWKKLKKLEDENISVSLHEPAVVLPTTENK